MTNFAKLFKATFFNSSEKVTSAALKTQKPQGQRQKQHNQNMRDWCKVRSDSLPVFLYGCLGETGNGGVAGGGKTCSQQQKMTTSTLTLAAALKKKTLQMFQLIWIRHAN